MPRPAPRHAGRERPADASQLEQAIVNLAANARDAMRNGGRLSVTTANADLDAAAPGGLEPGAYVLLSVGDTGVGMDEQTLAHAFDPFFTTKELEIGAGLGLATVHGIVEQSGGHIRARSERGRGTVFEIYLPRCEEPLEAESRGAEDMSGGSETILLVEDEDVVRNLVAEILAGSGYTVLEAASSAEAIERCAAHGGKIDLLLTDVVMPGESGRALAERLESTVPGVRVVYMSGYAGDEVTDRGLVAAGAAFLQKPFSADELVRTVRAALDAGRRGPT